jgi:hypothetical protein
VSHTPGPRDLAGLVAAIPHGDRSAAAATTTARIAFFLLDDANRNGEFTFVNRVLTQDSPLRSQIVAGKNLRAQKHAHVVSEPVTQLSAHSVRLSANTADIEMSFHYPAVKGVTTTGEVIEDDPAFDAIEVFVMVYVGDQWRLTTTKAA